MAQVVLFFPKLSKKSHESRLLPASVLMVAAPLVARGYEVKIIDQRVDDNWAETLKSELKNKPLLVGFSVLTGEQILHALEATEVVKENSDALVVWGGVHPSLLPEQTLENKLIDLVVVGEGEQTFLELFERVKDKRPLDGILGLAYKKNEKVFYNPREEFIDLDKLSPMPYELIDVENYVSKKSFASGQVARNLAFYTSRGCPHRCGFCYNQKFNKRRWRGMSAEKVVGEMRELIENYKINAFEIEDDEFFVDLERAKKICELIIKNNWDIEIFATCRANYLSRMDDDYLKLIKKAGFKTLAFGVESGSKKILALANKDITLEQVLDSVRRLKKTGINSKYYFMAGFPTETENDLHQTTDLIRQMKNIDNGIRIPAWRVFTPYPGTDLYDLSLRDGWKAPASLEEWANYDFATAKMPWLDGRRKKIIKNVAFLSKYLALQNKYKSGWYFNLGRWYGKLTDSKWQKRRFVFLPERIFIETIVYSRKLIKSWKNRTKR